MAFLAPVVPYITALGAGVSLIGGLQQAKSAQSVAAQNALLQQQNAATQAQGLQTKALLERSTAQQNLRIREMEARARFDNANTLKSKALAQESLNNITIRRKREEAAKLTATQRARFAASGIVDTTGSPLSLIAETAGIVERDIAETKYTMGLQEQGLFQEAALERLGGRYALAGATLDADSALAGAGLTEASATATLISGNRAAEITRLTGSTQAQGLRFQAFGNLLGDLPGVYKAFA